MAKPCSHDLRRRILQAYAQGGGTQAQLAQRFRVSLGYIEKIRGQQRRTGQMEGVPHHPGRKPKFTEPIREQLRGWLRQQPDCTLAELQARLAAEKHLRVSVPSLWLVLRKIGLRLKKSHSTPANETQKKPVSGEKNSSSVSVRSRRKS